MTPGSIDEALLHGFRSCLQSYARLLKDRGPLTSLSEGELVAVDLLTRVQDLECRRDELLEEGSKLLERARRAEASASRVESDSVKPGWVHVSQVREGTLLIADGEFSPLPEGTVRIVLKRGSGWYVAGLQGGTRHYLRDQTDVDGLIVGFRLAPLGSNPTDAGDANG
ncbi:hypothetical protein DES32_3202 [Methylovirgula ligni]|uniref:Uncharacterized protein n=1 Tax=Methylovirgula ligni TaxID=569860 RepID=A0A3D9YL56_9HYPH|nr:hypothetical protein DES32_3202 [Methylovirgula ligni]